MSVAVTAEGVTFAAPDGAVARCQPPFWESQTALPGHADAPSPSALTGLSPEETADAVASHALAERAVGVLLVRLGGYAAGVFTGSPPALADHKSGSRLVHGRSAAGGWSQRRFARRREQQASQALHAAVDAAAEVFGRWGAGTIRSGDARGTRGTGLNVLVLGGDKRAVAAVTGDPRLAPYLKLATGRFLTVPDPRLTVLRDTPRLFLAVRIFLTEPAT